MDAKKIQDIPLSVGTQDRLDVGVEREDDDLKGEVLVVWYGQCIVPM